MVYELLVMYHGGVEWIVKDVVSHGITSSGTSYYYIKNNHTSYVPIHAVLYFGRDFD